MSSIELTSSQETILTALINLFRESEEPVKGETIAEQVNRNPGTIRNQMQSLKALQLVEGVPGPKGGYKPTADAYEALDVKQMDEPASVPLVRDGDELENVNVEAINLSTVHHPELCRAEITIQGSVREFSEGDAVRVGPTPLSKLTIRGTVDATNGTSNVVILKIGEMQAPTETPAH